MKNIRLAGLAGAIAVSLFAQSAFAYQVEDFIDYYLLEQGNLHNWNLTVDAAPSNSRLFLYPSASGGQQVSLQGSLSSSAVPTPGTWVDLWTVVPERGSGAGNLVSFQWMFATENNGVNSNPSGGVGDRVDFFYSLGTERRYTTLANNANGIGTFSTLIPSAATEIGWRVYSDNDRMADVFTVGAFTAPVPEPGTLLLSGLFLAVGGFFYHQKRKNTA
jgi:hypothetical protein